VTPIDDVFLFVKETVVDPVGGNAVANPSVSQNNGAVVVLVTLLQVSSGAHEIFKFTPSVLLVIHDKLIFCPEAMSVCGLEKLEIDATAFGGLMGTLRVSDRECVAS